MSDELHVYNESLVMRARARATGADVHAVGEMTAAYYFACRDPKRYAYNCKLKSEILQIYVDTKLSLKEAKAEQNRQVGIRAKPALIVEARKYVKQGKKLDPDEFNTPGWKESWLAAIEEVKKDGA